MQHREVGSRDVSEAGGVSGFVEDGVCGRRGGTVGESTARADDSVMDRRKTHHTAVKMQNRMKSMRCCQSR
jgi:hypothetical protein